MKGLACACLDDGSGLPCPPPGDLPHPGIEPVSLTSPELASEFLTTSATWETQAPTVGTNTPPALEEGGEVFAGELRSNQVSLLQKVFYQQITSEEPFPGIRNLFDTERGANPGCQLE